jgi:lambda family phage tail tape measure protein
MKEKLEDVKLAGLKGLEDGLIGVLNGTQSVADAFKSMASSIIADLMRIAIQQAIIKPLMSAVGLPFANGGAFEAGVVKQALGGAWSGGVQFFATGGVVNRPSAFGMKGGKMGVMGEAGPEAIMPLRRMSNGRLGIEGTAGSTNVTVNVDAGGSAAQSQVSGDDKAAARLGKAIANAVQMELVKQKRPGGLLHA